MAMGKRYANGSMCHCARDDFMDANLQPDIRWNRRPSLTQSCAAHSVSHYSLFNGAYPGLADNALQCCICLQHCFVTSIQMYNSSCDWKIELRAFANALMIIATDATMVMLQERRSPLLETAANIIESRSITSSNVPALISRSESSLASTSSMYAF